MVLFVPDTVVQEVLEMKDCITALKDTYLRLDPQDTDMPSRLMVKTLRGRLMVMPISVGGSKFMGIKTYTVFDKVRFLYLLFDAEDGSLLALMDADYLGQLRTGAVSALATDIMSRRNSETVGMIGSGVQARTQLLGLRAIRNIKRVSVFSRNEKNREKFAEEMSANLGISVIPVNSEQNAVMNADVLVTSTPSRSPVVNGGWLKPGVHINAIGSTLPNLRELDDATIKMSSLIVVDSKLQVTKESGDIAIPLLSGLITSDGIHDLWELVKGAVSRREDSEITIFKSVGTALQDLVVASKAYEQARTLGLGKELDDLLVSRMAATK